MTTTDQARLDAIADAEKLRLNAEPDSTWCTWCGAPIRDVEVTHRPVYCDRECWLAAGGQL